MGVTDCDNMLMLLGVSTKMTEKERDVVIPLMMRGFKVRCRIPIIELSPLINPQQKPYLLCHSHVIFDRPVNAFSWTGCVIS